MLATVPFPTRTSALPTAPRGVVHRAAQALVPPRDPATRDDGELVARAAIGDDRAFAELVRRHSRLLRAVASEILPGSGDVDDVVQDAFVAAWMGMGRVLDGDAIVGWLVTTVRRRSVDRLRSADHRRRGDLVDEPAELHEQCPDVVAERASMLAAARRLLDTMPEVQRRSWELRHLEQLGYREIADRLGIRESTVRGQIARARARLRAERTAWN